MTQNITDNERAMLNKILHSEYHDEETEPMAPVWLSCVAKSKADGGVITSLQVKGLVSVFICDDKTENTIQLTDAGLEATK